MRAGAAACCSAPTCGRGKILDPRRVLRKSGGSSGGASEVLAGGTQGSELKNVLSGSTHGEIEPKRMICVQRFAESLCTGVTSHGTTINFIEFIFAFEPSCVRISPSSKSFSAGPPTTRLSGIRWLRLPHLPTKIKALRGARC